jgi:hypothetical protein
MDTKQLNPRRQMAMTGSTKVDAGQGGKPSTPKTYATGGKVKKGKKGC